LDNNSNLHNRPFVLAALVVLAADLAENSLKLAVITYKIRRRQLISTAGCPIDYQPLL
jgi:hypothetical protein